MHTLVVHGDGDVDRLADAEVWGWADPLGEEHDGAALVLIGTRERAESDAERRKPHDFWILRFLKIHFTPVVNSSKLTIN